jgi:hypothetical protein
LIFSAIYQNLLNSYRDIEKYILFINRFAPVVLGEERTAVETRPAKIQAGKHALS